MTTSSMAAHDPFRIRFCHDICQFIEYVYVRLQDLEAVLQTFTISSSLCIAPDDFWSRMTMASVNSELAPFVQMTSAPQWNVRALGDWPTGQVLFRSIILLFGVLPVDIHKLKLDHIDPGRGFLERSSSWTYSLWQHERTTTKTNDGCTVTDTVSFQGRIPLLEHLLLPIYRAAFRHRHTRLKIRFGTPVSQTVL